MSAVMSVLQRNRMINIVTGFAQTNYGLASTASSSIKVYTGAAPGIENVATGTLLATYPMYSSTTSQSLLTGPSGGVAMLLAAITMALATASGTAGYARWVDSSGTAAVEGSVGVTASGADFILDSLSITINTPTTIQAASVKLPNTIGTVQLNSTLVDAILQMLVQNTGSAPGLGASGSIYVYTGSAPASVESAATGTLLAQFSTGTQGWSAAAAAVANLVSTLSVAPVATGTAGYVRWVKGAYTIQCSVGTSGTDVIVDTTAFVVAVTRNITDMSLTF